MTVLLVDKGSIEFSLFMSNDTHSAEACDGVARTVKECSGGVRVYYSWFFFSSCRWIRLFWVLSDRCSTKVSTVCWILCKHLSVETSVYAFSLSFHQTRSLVLIASVSPTYIQICMRPHTLHFLSASLPAVKWHTAKKPVSRQTWNWRTQGDKTATTEMRDWKKLHK